MNYKVDIFKLLKDISMGKMSSIDELTPEELKTVSPYVMQMWIKGADNNVDERIVLTNECVNPYVFSLQDHPKLLFKLLCYSNGLMKPTRFKFKKKAKSVSGDFAIKTLMQYFKYSYDHASDIIPLLSADEIRDIGHQLGYDKDEMKKL